MKKSALFLLPLLALCSCGNNNGGGNRQPQSIEINTINWKTYCNADPRFLGLQNKELVAACTFQIDSNYRIETPVTVSLKVTFKTYYYAGLTGGPKTYMDLYFYFDGTVDSYSKLLTPRYNQPYSGSNEFFNEGTPTVNVTSISGRLSR